MTFVATINNRRIRERAPIGAYTSPWWLLEIAGPLFEGTPITVWLKFDGLGDAIAEAARLGPMSNQPDRST